MKRFVVKGIALTALTLLFTAGPAAAAWNALNTSFGQRVVIGVAHGDLSYTKDAQTVTQLAMSVVLIRNNNLSAPIQLNSLRFHSSGGAFVKALLPAARVLRPLETARFEIKQSTLGIAPYPRMQANCKLLLEWQSSVRVAPPSINSTVYVVRPDGNGVQFDAATSGVSEVVAERVP